MTNRQTKRVDSDSRDSNRDRKNNDANAQMHYGSEQRKTQLKKPHFSTSEAVSERASKRVSTAERASQASSAEQANE